MEIKLSDILILIFIIIIFYAVVTTAQNTVVAETKTIAIKDLSASVTVVCINGIQYYLFNNSLSPSFNTIGNTIRC